MSVKTEVAGVLLIRPSCPRGARNLFLRGGSRPPVRVDKNREDDGVDSGVVRLEICPAAGDIAIDGPGRLSGSVSGTSFGSSADEAGDAAHESVELSASLAAARSAAAGKGAAGSGIGLATATRQT